MQPHHRRLQRHPGLCHERPAGRACLQRNRADAYAQGYTEPDPRDDLNGLDVARKALILARGLGWRLDLADVDVQGLYPASMDGLSVQEFLAELPALDKAFRAAC